MGFLSTFYILLELIILFYIILYYKHYIILYYIVLVILPFTLMFHDNEDNKSIKVCKNAMIFCTKSYMPNDLSLALLGVSSHIYHTTSTLPIKVSIIYIINSI